MYIYCQQIPWKVYNQQLIDFSKALFYNSCFPAIVLENSFLKIQLIITRYGYLLPVIREKEKLVVTVKTPWCKFLLYFNPPNLHQWDWISTSVYCSTAQNYSLQNDQSKEPFFKTKLNIITFQDCFRLH